MSLPRQVGRVLKQGDSFGSVESVKAASDVYAPVSGKVTAVNAAVKAEPSLINKKPADDGWLIKIELSAPKETDKLFDLPKYEQHCKDSAH